MGRYIEMVGKKFGRLTVIHQSESFVSDAGRKQSVWHCLCECGNECDVKGTYLRNGTTKSCGCLKKEISMKKNYKDLTGMTFGELTVLDESAHRNNKIYWECACKCGSTVQVSTSSLISGHTTSCGCKRKEKSHGRYKDLVGLKFGHLTVTDKLGTIVKNNGNKVIEWRCRCDCGNLTTAKTTDLTQRKKQSCGCTRFQRSYNDLTGMKFGKLTVIKRIEDKITSSGRKRMLYNCICDCGNECNVYGESLMSNNAKSCGCIKSYGEYAVKQFLTENLVSFETQKKYSDLIGINGGKLSYDFFLPQYNLLIECQGGQHYSPVEQWGGEQLFIKQQEHDKRKKEYAQKHNIELFIIDYQDYNNIDTILKDKLQQHGKIGSM